MVKRKRCREGDWEYRNKLQWKQ